MTRPLITPPVIAALSQQFPRRAVLVWCYLWACADRETGEAWPAGGTIARALATNRNHVMEDIEKLTLAGWLRRDRRAGASNLYSVLDPTATGCNRGGTTLTGGCNRDGTPPVSMAGQGVYPPRDTNPTRNPTSEHKQARSKKKFPAFDPFTIELPYRSERFRTAWRDFCQNRLNKKKPMTELAASRILAKCQKWGEDLAVEALDNSIIGEWTDIYWPKSSTRSERPRSNGAPKTEPVIFSAAE